MDFINAQGMNALINTNTWHISVLNSAAHVLAQTGCAAQAEPQFPGAAAMGHWGLLQPPLPIHPLT